MERYFVYSDDGRFIKEVDNLPLAIRIAESVSGFVLDSDNKTPIYW